MLIDRYKESTIQFTAIPRSAMSVSVLKALCTQKHYNDRKAAPALSRPPSIEHESQSMRVRRDGYESEIESDFGKIEFSPQLSSLRPFSFPFHSLLSVSKSHPKGSPCLTTRLTIRPLSRYPSISPLPFSLRSHRAFSRPVPGPPSPSPCNARHSARTVMSSLRVCGYFCGKRN